MKNMQSFYHFWRAISMNKLLLTDEELNYLELILHNCEYEESEKHLIDSLEFKFYKVKSDNYQNKLTTIGGN